MLQEQPQLMTERNTETFIPQVHDMVYYFVQGHEDYMVEYSCHFFAGQSEKYPKRRTMPWVKNK